MKFGTDGIRSQDTEALSEAAYRMGAAQKGKDTIVVAEDNRPTSGRIVKALLAGLDAAGVNVLYGGVMPTAALQYAVRYFTADGGVMVTASHNPPKYNGLKYINQDGQKPSEEELGALEAAMEGLDYHGEEQTATPSDNLAKAYIEKFRRFGTLPLKVAVDCANGAAYPIVKRVLSKHVEEAEYLHHGEGKLINRDCGALHPLSLAEEMDADMGFALDGDGDRCVLVTKAKRIADGDGILYLLAKYHVLKGLPTGGAVAGTVMSNGGLAKALSALGLRLIRGDVGDVSVAKVMRERGLALGGEPSGHILTADHVADGIYTGLLLAEAAAEYDPDELLEGYTPLPQYHTQIALTPHAAKQALVARDKWQDYLAGTGRVVVRPSGTEPVVRVMVECESAHLAQSIGESIVQATKKGC